MAQATPSTRMALHAPPPVLYILPPIAPSPQVQHAVNLKKVPDAVVPASSQGQGSEAHTGHQCGMLFIRTSIEVKAMEVIPRIPSWAPSVLHVTPLGAACDTPRGCM